MSRNEKNLVTIRDIVGDEKFREIAETLNGENVYFNSNGNQGYVSKHDRDEDIWKDFLDNADAEQLAEKYGLSPGTIYKIVEKRGFRNL